MGLAEQYKKVLGKQLESTAVVFDYADPVDFKVFWNAMCAKDVFPDPKGKALIIAWDGMPTDSHVSDKLLHQHLTPLDWALAFSIKLLSDPLAGVADFSIHILDFTVKEFEDAHSFKIIGTLLDEMPWVKIYAPLKPANARYRRRHEKLEDITKLNLGANTFAKSVSGNQQGCKAALMDIAQLWRASVLQSNDHHDLNNIVGPQIISKMMSDTALGGNNSSELECAFLKRLEWSGLCPALGKNDQYEAPPFNQQLDIVVIDDQLARGWDQVLGSLVGLPPMEIPVTPNESLALFRSNGSLNLHGATNPSCLLDALGISEVSGSPHGVDSVAVMTELYNQRKFDSPVSKIEGSRPWMLVLDMRLFSGQISLEREWYAMLAKAALQISSLDKSKLAWHGFEENGKQLEGSEKEVAQLKEGEQLKYLANGGELDEAHIDTALSLFPRLCALRWPSVPIIVFSSTRRRELIAKLAKYGNIFLSSSKPNVLVGNPDGQVDAFIASWGREFGAAIKLIDVQKNLLCLMERFSQDAIAKGKTKASTSVGQHKHVVLAFDEAGDFDPGKSPAVGGVIALVDAISREDALQKFAEFEERSRAEGLKFYDFAPVNWSSAPTSEIKDSSHSALPKGTPVSTKLVPLLQQNNSLKMGVFRLSITIPQRTNSCWNDNEYMLALRACLELALCELPRSVGIQWGASSSLAIWLPSRQRPFVSEAQAIKESRQYDFRWEQKKSKYVESLGGYGAAYSIVVSAIGGRGNASEIIGSVTGVKTRTIPYTNIPQRRGEAQSALFWHCQKCKQAIFPRGHSPKTLQRIKCNHGNFGGTEDPTWPDYTVMLHLADAMLGLGDLPAEKDCEAVMDKDISFDVVLDMKVHDFLHASRLFDQEQSPDAFKLGFKHVFFTEGLNRLGGFSSAKIESGLVAQFWQHALQVNGNTLTELAGIRTRGIEPTSKNAAANTGSTLRSQEPALQGPESKVNQAASSKGVRQVVNKVAPQSHHAGAAAANKQSHNEKNIKKTGPKVEAVWVQTVEADGFWVTFGKGNIGKTNKDSNPPSGWCPLDGHAAPPAEGDEINVVFEPKLGNKNGFCFVRQV